MAYSVLVVDDSAVVRAVVIKTLRLTGLEWGDIHQAGNGKEALEVLDKAWVDIVFADINMPVMNGIELVDSMAARGMLHATPVVIISTERSITRIEELKAKGVSAYLHKPFTPENIKGVVDHLLGGGREQ